MDTTQTLHDFVLNLLTDADARSAFDLDPEGALNAAGLSDVTALDVQDVVPLVMDYAPVQGITSLDVLGDNGLGLGAVNADPLGVIGQLTSVTQGLNLGTQQSGIADVNVTALGVVGLDTTGGIAASVLPGIGVGVGANGVTAELSGVNDVAHTLDAGVLNPVTLDVVGAVGTVDGVVAGASGTVDGVVGGQVGGTLDGLLGDGLTGVAGGALGTVGHTVDGLGVGGLLGGVTGTVGGTVDGLGVDGVVGGVTGTVGGTVDGLGVDGVVGGVTGTVGGTLDSVGIGGVTGGLGLHGDADASGHGLLGGLL
ncbi:IniB N-terminal domain-containing protein [Micromonospora sp. NPDC049679]|uniref:IniB N-terminal domain-containing protein n=1 Tax=Micromonospora sp. NPDC049679 TaxID=3155920 RepID=UPI00340CE1A7